MTARQSSGQMRTCLGCSKPDHQTRMIRMVRDPEGRIAFDLGRRLPGRGAYVCPNSDCLKKTLKARKLKWAFKKDTRSPSPEEAMSELDALFRSKITGLLGMAARSGSVASGSDAVMESLDRKRSHLLITAAGLSEKSVKRITSHAEGITSIKMNAVDPGEAVGRSGRMILSIENRSFAEAILAVYDKSASFGLVI